MQAQSKSASAAPLVKPQVQPEAPIGVPPRPERPGGASWYRYVIAAAVLTAAVALYWRHKTSETANEPGETMRTASVISGPVETTLRLSGVTAAENFASLTSPRLQGSRSDRLRAFLNSPSNSTTSTSSSTSSTGTSSTSTTSSTGSTTSSSTASSASSTSSGTAASTTPGANTGAASGPGANMSAALKASTSRLQNTPASTAPSLSTTTRSTNSTGSVMPPSDTMGTDGLGTTSSQLSGGTGGPPTIGGSSSSRGDFSLLLEKAVPPGTHVKKGDTIAEFDRQYMLLRLDDYKASLAIAENNMTVEKAQIAVEKKAHAQLVESAKGELDKARLDMQKIPVLSAIDTERTKLALAEAEARYKQLLFEVKYVDISEKAQIRASEIDLQETRIETRRAELNADKLIVKAPIDGLTVMQSTWRGDQLGQIRPGDQLWPGQSLMSVVDPSSIIVEARVNQVDAQRMRIGQRARIRFDAYPDLELPGHVYSIASMPKPGTFRATYIGEIPVRIKLEKLDPRVIPDLSVSADVILASEPRATVAPLAAIFHDRAGQDAKSYVYLRAGGRWEPKEVELGPASNISVAVRSGLKPGDTVALDRPGSESRAALN